MTFFPSTFSLWLRSSPNDHRNGSRPSAGPSLAPLGFGAAPSRAPAVRPQPARTPGPTARRQPAPGQSSVDGPGRDTRMKCPFTPPPPPPPRPRGPATPRRCRAHPLQKGGLDLRGCSFGHQDAAPAQGCPCSPRQPATGPAAVLVEERATRPVRIRPGFRTRFELE